MNFFVILLSLCVFTLGSEEPSFRIYKGKETKVESHPHQVGLFYKGQLICGGAIVNKMTIVTAAHCVTYICMKTGDLTIRVGSTLYSQGEEYPIDEIFVHEKFNTDNCAYFAPDYDVAVIKMTEPFTFSDKVKSIELQTANTPVPENKAAIVSGWGLLEPSSCSQCVESPDHLHEVKLSVMTNEDCQDWYKKISDRINITDRMLCAFNKDRGTMPGDSGGPLVADNKLIGIVSFGGTGGLNLYLPRAFANVSALHDFIVQHM